jgi:hypothetical protein
MGQFINRTFLFGNVNTECPPGYVWDTHLDKCVQDNYCPEGYIWDTDLDKCVRTGNNNLPIYGLLLLLGIAVVARK